MPQGFQKRPGDTRLGELIRSGKRSAKITLVGFPFDNGVLLNFGRPGARGAPSVIRQRLMRLTPDARNFSTSVKLLKQVIDWGNVKVPQSILGAQSALGKEISKLLADGSTPVILGGGHETTFGHFLGYADNKTPVTLVNFDAHPDVRERIGGSPHSGSSFRDALEHPSKCARGYAVFGLQPHSVAKKHLDYLAQKRAKMVWADECSEKTIAGFFKSLKTDALVSIDMDCIDQSFAPGVSAPCTNGLSPELILYAVRTAARCRRVKSLDIVEVNPKFDRDDQTSRLAALIVWTFLMNRAFT